MQDPVFNGLHGHKRTLPVAVAAGEREPPRLTAPNGRK